VNGLSKSAIKPIAPAIESAQTSNAAITNCWSP
jgi:hypothetical protein